MLTKKFFYGIAGLLALAVAVSLFFFMNRLSGIFTSAELFSNANPAMVFVIFCLLVLASIYLFGLAAIIFKETVK